MRRRTVLLALVATLIAPAGARAAEHTITMPGKSFTPARSSMVAGDTVVFRNRDLVTHDVRLGNGVFDSGPIGRFRDWSQLIAQPGTYPFVCSLHAFMSGNLDVVPATLAVRSGTVLAGEPVALSGRAPAGSGPIALERSTPVGGWVGLATITPAPDGTFAITTPASEGASYRVSTAAGPSPTVTPRVTASIAAHIEVRGRRDHRTVHLHAAPAPAGFVATLELYSRWHFAWRAEQRRRLDSRGHARFRVRTVRRGLVRVTLSRRARGPALVRSRVVWLGSGRGARDPDTTMPPVAGDHDTGAHGYPSPGAPGDGTDHGAHHG